MIEKFNLSERKRLAVESGIGDAYLYQCLRGLRDTNPDRARAAEAGMSLQDYVHGLVLKFSAL